MLGMIFIYCYQFYFTVLLCLFPWISNIFAWAVKFLFEHLKRRKYIWSKPDEDYIWKMSTIRLTYCTISDLRNLMDISLGMVLVMQAILCVHAELKLKPMNISSFLQYLKFYITSKFSKFKCKKMFLFYCMVLKKNNNSKSLNDEILKNVISYLKATT